MFLFWFLAHLEPELELFEVWDDGEDDLSHHNLQNERILETVTDKISLEQLRKLENSKLFGHSRASKNKKRIFHILFVFPALTHICYMFRAQG